MATVADDMPLKIEDDDNSIVIRGKDGTSSRIHKGGMTDAEWADVKSRAAENGTLSRADREAEKEKDRPKLTVADDMPEKKDSVSEPDFMEVEVAGKVINIPRGDMTLAEWNAAKEKAQKQGIFVKGMTSGADVELTDSSVSPSDRRKVEASKSGSGGGFYSNIRKVVGDQVKVANPEARDDAADLEPNDPAAAADAAQLPPNPGLKKAGTDTLKMFQQGISEVVDSASDLSDNVRQTLKETLQDTAHQVLQAPIDATPKPFRPENPVPAVPGPNAVQGAASLAQDAGKIFAPPPMPPGPPGAPLPPNAVPALGAVNNGFNPGAGIPGGVGLPPPPPPKPMSAGGSASVSMGMKGPGPANFKMPPPTENELMLRDSAALQRQAISEQARLKQEALGKQADLDGQKARYLAHQQESMQRTQEYIAGEKKRVIGAYEGTVQKIMQQDFKVDPGRYWSNLDAGRKVLWVLAGMFSRGKTNQNLMAMIDNDIAAQKEAIAGKKDALRQGAAGQMNLLQQFRLQGLDAFEAEKATRAVYLEGVKAQADQLEKQYGTAAASATANQLRAQSDMDIAKDLAAMESHRHAQAVKEAQLQQDQRELQFKMSEAARARREAAGGGRPIRSAEAGDLGNIKAAHEIAMRLKERFGEKNIFVRGFDKIAGLFPKTEASGFNKQRDLALNYIGRMVDGSVLQKHDLERWEKMMPISGDLMGEEALQVLVDDIKTTYNERLKSMGPEGAGYSVGGLKPIPDNGAPADPFGKVVR